MAEKTAALDDMCVEGKAENILVIDARQAINS